MLKNLSKILFIIMLMMGTLIVINSNSILSMWMGLEINLMSFIPLLMNSNNLNNSEASLNYFLIQVFASMIMLFSLIINLMDLNNLFMLNMMDNEMMFNKLIIMTLMMKLGSAPFHFWFPNVMENISWNNCLILMTWQKIAPMMILSHLINTYKFIIFFIIFSAIVGAFGGLNQISLRKLLTFSSINHLSWMMMALKFNEKIWLIYFISYTFINMGIIMFLKMFQIFYFNQMNYLFMNSFILKFNLAISLLSLGGLPPFLGFLPKWLIIQSMIFMKMNFINIIMIFMSLITLYYYLKITFSSFMISSNEINWNYKNFMSIKMWILTLTLIFISLSTFFFVFNMMIL